MILNKAIRSISYDNRQILLCIERILLSLGLVSTNLNCVMDAFFKKDYTASIKKMERRPRDTQKVIFLFYFWVENMLSKHMERFFKFHFKHCRLDQWYCVGSVTTSARMFWLEYGKIIFYFFIFHDFSWLRNHLCEDV